MVDHARYGFPALTGPITREFVQTTMARRMTTLGRGSENLNKEVNRDATQPHACSIF